MQVVAVQCNQDIEDGFVKCSAELGMLLSVLSICPCLSLFAVFLGRICPYLSYLKLRKPGPMCGLSLPHLLPQAPRNIACQWMI